MDAGFLGVAMASQVFVSPPRVAEVPLSPDRVGVTYETPEAFAASFAAAAVFLLRFFNVLRAGTSAHK